MCPSPLIRMVKVKTRFVLASHVLFREFLPSLIHFLLFFLSVVVLIFDPLVFQSPYITSLPESVKQSTLWNGAPYVYSILILVGLAPVSSFQTY
jgi:hypothetical protein